MIAMLIVAAQGLLPPPLETGLQPPMSFSCMSMAPGDTARLEGRINRFFATVSPGAGLMAIPQGGVYRDHMILEVTEAPFAAMKGRYDLTAEYPVDVDKAVLKLPADSTGAGYSLALYPPRSGHGYPVFTKVVVERGNRNPVPSAAAPDNVWFGSCNTILPQPAKPKP